MYLQPLPAKDGNYRTWCEAKEMVCLRKNGLTPQMRPALKHLHRQVGPVTTHTEHTIEASRLDSCFIRKIELAKLSVALGQAEVLEEYLDGAVEKHILLSGVETKNVNGCTYTTGFTALHKAAGEASPSITTLLLKHGADPNAYRTALMEAALWGRLDNVNELLAGGSDQNIGCSRGGKELRAVDFARRCDDSAKERYMRSGGDRQMCCENTCA
ncbi:hypothetical protein PgNI_05542 [Pyricularia grisea]|uniref:Uncharacterized protein n=1 Tax=Pyricularia grisea TaxID=148305 RepID=A0A6P8B6Q2_PYRGI|nr:hypothetical protein PgNI_05542 [Pyricularia grisea]TLD10945.1 hypothetical protein PgNI_05542 [Pyricularia grisea]